MPNGKPDFDQSEFEVWFAPLADVITKFAHARNLFLEKYYHQNCSWDLRFNHPHGGQGSVTVYCPTASTARIGSAWHLDEYASFTRSIHWRHPREIAKDPDALGLELSAELAAITAVPIGNWNQVATGFERIWGQRTKEEFERMAPQYPDPILRDVPPKKSLERTRGE